MMEPRTVFLAIVLSACTGGSSRSTDAGPPVGDASTDANTLDASLWLPLAPSADNFGWQGSQNRILDSVSQQACGRANITLAMWERAVCFGAHDGQLMCAGRIGDTVFGPSFVPAGIENVVQLLGSPTFNTDSGSAACALKDDGTAWCLGNGTNAEQFNTADGLQPGASWTQWGTRDDITEIATGTMDSICAIYQDKTASCAGYMAPQTVGSGNIHNLWIDTAGVVHTNDVQVFRVSNSRSACVIGPKGLSCTEPPEIVMPVEQAGAEWGEHGVLVTPTSDGGKIVDGNAAGHMSLCWLTANGAVSCLEHNSDPLPDVLPDLRSYFEGKRALALGVNFYARARDRCAVISDGSLWCIGGNEFGQLGTGTMGALAQETLVQPAGTVRINCSPKG